jgi:fatty acid desaturase
MFFLRYKADLRMLMFEAVFIGLVYHRWNYVDSSWLTSTLLFIATMQFCFFQAVATHNCVHVPPFSVPALNRWWNVVLSCTIGHPVSTFIPGHNYSHHKYMETRKDIMRTCQMKYKWNFLNLVLFAPTINGQTMRNDFNYFKAQRAKGRPIYNQLLLEFTVTYAMLAYFVYTDPLRFVHVLWIPQLWAKYCLITLNMLQHDGCDPDSKANFARNFVGPLLNYFCYDNGFHTQHHMYAGWHWSILPEKHAKIVHPHIHPNLEQESILGYMFRAYVYPGKRTWYDGSDYKWAPDSDQPNIDWAYDQAETHGNIGGLGEKVGEKVVDVAH